jgi:NAD-dependent dihydropyrimidine dehydrogenase PreA subunit
MCGARTLYIQPQFTRHVRGRRRIYVCVYYCCTGHGVCVRVCVRGLGSMVFHTEHLRGREGGGGIVSM